jgi:CRP-like cAMP-binding protein
MLGLPGLHSWVAGLPEPVKKAVFAACSRRKLAAGEAVYTLGSKPEACYIIERGRVRIFNVSDSGREVTLGELRSGDCIGEVGMIDGMPRFNTAVATEASELQVLARADFDRLYASHPEIARELNRLLAYRVWFFYMHAEESRALSLGQRLARLLARTAYGVGIPQDNGEILLETLSQEALANMLGGTRQAVSQEMKRLERAGLLRTSYGKVYVRDLAGLLQPVEDLIGAEAVVPTYPPE